MSDPPTEAPGARVWERLRRRKVVQWTFAYAALAWLALQILSLVAESYDWPHSVMRAAIGVAATGLATAFVVAWFHGERGAQRVGAVEGAILTLVVVMGGTYVWWMLRAEEHARPVPASQITAPTTPADRRPSIAVLPFENRSPDANDAYFADGMHDDILTQLSRLGALRIISRNSVERFRKTALGTKEIAAQLGVTTLLEGSVQRLGPNVRISVQLIDARTDSQLWAETYYRQLSAANVFAIQSEVAESIATILRASLTPDERARSKAVPTQNLDAWRYFQLGRQKLAQRNAAAFEDALTYFGRAIEADPKFAPAYAGLSEAMSLRMGYTSRPVEHPVMRADAAAERAMQLDPSLAEGWVAAGIIAANNGQVAEAEGLFRRAIELDPNNATAHKFYAPLLIQRGNLDAGTAQLQTASNLDPLSPVIQVNLGDALEAQGKLREAEACFRRAIELDPTFANAYGAYSGLLTATTTRYAEAEPLMRKMVELDPENPYNRIAMADYFLQLGDQQRFVEIVEDAAKRWPDSYPTQMPLAIVAMLKGDAATGERQARRALEMNPTDGDALGLIRNVRMQQGRPEEALALYRKFAPEIFTARGPEVIAKNWGEALDVAVLLQNMGQTSKARELFDGVAPVFLDRLRVGAFGYGIADVVMYAASGDRDRALAALREAQKIGWYKDWWYYRDYEPALDSIRGDPMFKEVFSRIERDMRHQRRLLEARRSP